MAVRDGGPDPSANSMLNRFIKVPDGAGVNTSDVILFLPCCRTR